MGAAIALDARFLALANNAGVGTWTSRTGSNDVTQNTAANRPTFVEAARAGMPVVRFDGANSPNQDWLANSSFVVSQPFFVISATLFNTKRAAVLCDADLSTNRVLIGLNPTGAAADDGKLYMFSGTNAPTENADLRGVWSVVTALFDGSSSRLYRQGNEVASGNAGTTNFATLRIGERFANVSNITQHDGDIGTFVVVAGSSQPMRKRLEHAAALAYKIACS